MFGHKFRLAWHLVQNVLGLHESGLKFFVARLTEKQIELEFVGRLLEINRPAKPSVSLLNNALALYQVKRHWFIGMPNLIFSRMFKLVGIIFRHDLLWPQMDQHTACLQFLFELFPNILVLSARAAMFVFVAL